MIKYLLILILSSTAFASGPKYAYTDPKLDDEINNIYHDIGNRFTNYSSISSGTITHLTVSTLTVANIVNNSIKMTNWTAYTPTLTGVGTESFKQFFWRQIGDSIFVQGGWRCGTVAAASVSITLPNSTTISSSKLNSSVFPVLGQALKATNGATASFAATDFAQIFYDLSDASKVFLGNQASGGSILKTNGSTLFGNSDWISVQFSYPIN